MQPSYTILFFIITIFSHSLEHVEIGVKHKMPSL